MPSTPTKRPAARTVSAISTPMLHRAIRNALQQDSRPVLLFFAGPNGSGKTTLYETYRAGFPNLVFVNADLLARIIAGIPATDELAQKMGNLMRQHLLGHPTSFATETVFSDPEGDKLNYLRQAAAAGYRVVFIYTALANWQLSLMRVRHRVANGGHGVPEDRLQRRFDQSRRNCVEALRFVETGLVLDNSVVDQAPAPMALVQHGKLIAAAPGIPAYVAELLPPQDEARGRQQPRQSA